MKESKKYLTVILSLISFAAANGQVQCLIDDSIHLERFYIDTIKGNTLLHHEFEISEPFKGRDSYVSDQHEFFGHLKVITFDSALNIACRQKGLTTCLATLEVNGHYVKPVWYMEGKSHIRFGGNGPGNATVERRVVVIDAASGVIIDVKKVKTRAIVDF